MAAVVAMFALVVVEAKVGDSGVAGVVYEIAVAVAVKVAKNVMVVDISVPLNVVLSVAVAVVGANTSVAAPVFSVATGGFSDGVVNTVMEFSPEFAVPAEDVL